MKTGIHVWSYVAEFFLEWEMLQTEVVEEKKKFSSVTFFFFPKVVPFLR